VKTALRERRDALTAALDRDLPDARYVVPEGGYFLWIDLPDGIDVAELEALADERGVVFVKGTDFLLEGGHNSFRIAYSGVTPEQIDDAVARVAEAYRELAGARA
jgi:DNA-binding transcriptional MocR family regulator